MRILGIESSSLVASVAVLDEDVILAEYSINYKMTHSQTLLPMIASIKDITGFDLNDMDAVAVSGGPGSFTGLRIGVATAKGIAAAIRKPLINVSALSAMAYNFYKTDALIVPIMDARRQQVYTGSYENFTEFKCLSAPRAVGIDELVTELSKSTKEVIFLGDGVPVYREYIKENMKAAFDFAPAGFNRQKASSLLLLAKKYYEEGKTVEAGAFEIEYLRKSQAERERDEENSGCVDTAKA